MDALPPVETISTFLSWRSLASFTMPVLLDTEISARLIFINLPNRNTYFRFEKTDGDLCYKFLIFVII
jgi:hypothetical protein